MTEKEISFSRHPFAPFFDKSSTILILGSFPSYLSRKEGFYYGNPQNRFWKVLGEVYQEEEPLKLKDKESLLSRHHLALFDAYSALSILGSQDASIKDAKISDLSPILNSCPIKRILCNGKASYEGASKQKGISLPIIYLPSTSPANASYSLAKLTLLYKPYLLDSKI
jgi:hypoxanthine-DNA glycosylase